MLHQQRTIYSIVDDRDRSRAAAERYLILQAVGERSAGERGNRGATAVLHRVSRVIRGR